jgi:hypothetical protein
MVYFIVIVELILVDEKGKKLEESKCLSLREENTIFVWNPIFLDVREDLFVSELSLFALLMKRAYIEVRVLQVDVKFLFEIGDELSEVEH